MQTDIVLGASGFIGTRLVGKLTREGRRVIGADLAPPRQAFEGAEHRIIDVRSPEPDLRANQAGVLYNLAAVHRTPGHPPHEYYDTNIRGALFATRLAEKLGVRTIVFTSSISVYGPCEEEVRETSELRPGSDYGRSKRMAELIHERWADADEGRRLIVVRPGVIFGPGEGGNYTMLARALRNGTFFYPGRRDTVKSGGYVDELLQTVDFAMARPEKRILYNFAYPDMHSISEIVETFHRVSGTPRRPPTAPAPLLYAAASVFEAADALGLKNRIHRDRVRKLVQSTRVAPHWLLSSGYSFSTNLETALRAWAQETDGNFV